MEKMTKDEMRELRAMMEEVVAPIKEDMSEVKKRLTKLEASAENGTNKTVRILMENHASLVEKDIILNKKDSDLEGRI
jgi:arsenate reductase-like glutaredoxin family protein